MTDVAAFLRDLQLQRGKYREMIAAAAEQKGLLERNDLEALPAFVERKRVLMAGIEELEARLAPVKARWPELKAAGLDPGTVRAVEETVGELRGLLAELVRMEDEGRALLQGQRDRANEELQDLLRRKRALGAYGRK